MNYANGASVPGYDMNHHGPNSGGMPGADWGMQAASSARLSAPLKTEGFSNNDLPDDPSWSAPNELIYST